MKRHRTDRKTGKVTIATVYAVTSRHELPGVEGTYSEVTIAMEEWIVGYLPGVREIGGGGSRAVNTAVSHPSPRQSREPAPPLFSGLPTLEY
ncbi:hypothetical protein [Streptomyces atroolivaceus]|uniref:hypothetical protein n=1 Tax=Streptomyces atroolivaceus TaxID=66869 RepID=UPI002024FE05|nr:hypothetical protein [Streptomyces atroolivaceus]